MNTNTHTSQSSDLRLLAYGQEVEELLAVSSPAAWTNDLWMIYSDFMAFQKEAGHNPRMHDIFLSFRELLFFFQRLEKIGK
ncbi:hypothetical protein FEM33_07070 [Dyadobacter flavalbus]|uniref:Uncharacterized protein n=1 Tax=Dyadobacter flavalbus TaxID=2579942 RepID=A0A5M8QW18_9BACT|nr:hypothetical protein [Dyadobacter flavalbus]KAA6440359.1 hypothetical protein FEM33_07070 [Dyadobacter flavalbus]